MVPAEAALKGTAPIATVGGGLRDVSPPDAHVLALEDDEADAALVFDLLTNDQLRTEQLEAWRKLAETHRWESSASRLVDACASVLLQQRGVRLPLKQHVDPAAVSHAPLPIPPLSRLLRKEILHFSVKWFPLDGRRRQILKTAFGWAFR